MKLTPFRQKRLLIALDTSLSAKDAAAKAGMRYETVCRWRKETGMATLARIQLSQDNYDHESNVLYKAWAKERDLQIAKTIENLKECVAINATMKRRR